MSLSPYSEPLIPPSSRAPTTSGLSSGISQAGRVMSTGGMDLSSSTSWDSPQVYSITPSAVVLHPIIPKLTIGF
ncbi:hypothetical protein D3C81_1861790 [compost metagenome]